MYPRQACDRRFVLDGVSMRRAGAELYVAGPSAWEAPAIATQVDEILLALEVPKIDAETRLIFQEIIHRQKYFGGDPKGRIIFIIRAITESEGNEGALIGPIVSAVSSCLTPEIINRGLAVIEAFDRIPLLAILETMRSLDLFSEDSIGSYYSVAIRNKLRAILQPAVLPAAKPIKVKREPKPPLSVSRIPMVEKYVALGVKLLTLRATTPSNTRFGQRVRAEFNVDQILTSQAMRVAARYATRPEIYRAASWITLVELSSPKMSESVRQAHEAKILAGQPVTALQIRRARGRLKGGSPKRGQANHPASMAA
jgi:hypothetical protein